MRVVFICTGNTCRSPMAEGIFRVLLQENGITGVECTSCGLAACAGMPACEHAITAAAEYGADISAHRARALSRYLLDEGDLFVCMSGSHAMFLTSYVPNEKIRILGSGIPDPYGGDLPTYCQCAAAIAEGLKTILEEVKKT